MLMNKGDKKLFGREIKTPEKTHLRDFKFIERSMKAYPKKKGFLFEQYMDEIEKKLVKKKPHSPLISAISTTNNFSNHTLSTFPNYNTHYNYPINTEKFSRPNTNTELMSIKEKENNFYNNTKTSFFSMSITNPKTVLTNNNNNDELSFSNLKLLKF